MAITKIYKKEYRAWLNMLQRCNRRSGRWYSRYGGRGISVCDRWSVFQNFLDDMGRSPSRWHSLDRIDNNGNYDPSNCRWATRRQQATNRSSNRLLRFRGQTKLINDWSKILGIKHSTLTMRLNKYGWSAEKALGTSVAKRTKRKYA